MRKTEGKGGRRDKMLSIFAHSCRPPKLLVVVVFAAFVALAGLWSTPPLDRDESRYAQATAQMLETGDFVAIRFQEGERNKKPVGIHWLQAASVTAFSSLEARDIWAYRLPSLIGVVLAAAFTFLAAQRLYDPPTAFLAGLLLASAPSVAIEATIAKTDGALLAAICLAQYAFVEIYARMNNGGAATPRAAPEASGRATPRTVRAEWRWPVLFWAAQGVGVLLKGPIAPMISALTGLGLAAAGTRRGWITAMRPLLGASILLLMVLPWGLAIAVATQGRFFIEAVGVDLLGKVGEAQEGHAGPAGYHVALLWALFWPAAALLAPGFARLWRERGDWRARFLLAWILPSWLIFEIAATKLPHYVLPLYPALAIAAARAARPGVVHGFLNKASAGIYGVVGLMAAALIVAAPMLLSDRPLAPANYLASALIGVASLFIARLFWTGRAFGGGVAAAVLGAVFAWTMLGAVLPQLSHIDVSSRLSRALSEAGRHPLEDHLPPAALAGYHEPSAVFLLGTRTKLTNGAAAARDLAAGRVSAAIIEARETGAFLDAAEDAKLQPAPLAVVEGLNYSNGQRVALTIFIRGEKN